MHTRPAFIHSMFFVQSGHIIRINTSSPVGGPTALADGTICVRLAFRVNRRYTQWHNEQTHRYDVLSALDFFNRDAYSLPTDILYTHTKNDKHEQNIELSAPRRIAGRQHNKQSDAVVLLLIVAVVVVVLDKGIGVIRVRTKNPPQFLSPYDVPVLLNFIQATSIFAENDSH